MKKSVLLGIMVLLMAACQQSKPFTFVQMSDPQIGFHDRTPAFVHSDSLMRAAVDAANALNPAFVFITGDLVDDPADPLQDSLYRMRLAEIAAPVFTVPGNHDYLGGFTREKQKDYIALRGYDRFAFKAHGCTFIGMDSNCIKDGDKGAEEEQLEWLEKELSKAVKSRYTFVFLHCPVIRESMDEPEDYFNFSKEQRRQYIGLFKKYGVDFVLAGHCHQEWDTTVDGIRFVTAGPVGNALGHGTPGYNVVCVSKDGVEITYTPTPGIKPVGRR